MANWQSKTTSRSWHRPTREFTTSTTWQSTSPLPVTLGDEEVALSGTSPVSIVDADGNSMLQMDGNLGQVRVSDAEARQLLSQLIEQLKIFNLHMSLVTDAEIKEDDTGG